jgi:putative ABC transport system permease protein
VVNEAFVQIYLGGANAIGRRVRLDDARGGESRDVWHTVVGVVAGLGMSANDPDRAGGVFVPLPGQSAFRILVRTSARPADVMVALRTSAFSVDAGISVAGVRVLADVIQALRRVYLGIGTALTSLAGIVLLLSLMGIYAILSFEVTRRTREIGVRVALGAEVHDVVRPVLLRAVAYVGVGGVLGTALGAVLVAGARAMFVMRFPATGPATFSLLVGGVLVAAVAAAAVPTRRALAIEPSDALRAE